MMSFELRLLNRHFVHLILIALLGLLAYSNTFDVPFQWDEYPFIENNPIVKDLSYFLEPSRAEGLERYIAVKNRYIGYLTFALNYKIHGLDVKGYHVFNLTIHILNSLLVYFLVVLTFKTPYFNPPQSSSPPLVNTPLNPPLVRGEVKGGYIALFSALLFVSHPIQTEAVTYIFQRLASLCAFFYLLSIVLYIKWRVSVSHCDADASAEAISSSRIKTLPLYLLSLISAVLAMKTKENAFTLPLVIALYEFSFFKGSIKTRLLRLIPFLLTLSIIPLTLIGIDKPVGEIAKEIESVGFGHIPKMVYLLTQFRVIVTYIRLLFVPVNQNVDYIYGYSHSFFAPEVFFSFLFLFSIFSLGIYLFYRSRLASPKLRLVAFGIFWFFITLSVESSIIPLFKVINEYRLYLPSVGAFWAVSVGIPLMLKNIKGKKLPGIVMTLSILIPLVLSGVTYARNNVWKSNLSLWKDVVEKAPMNPTGHCKLGTAYLDRGLVDKAIEEYLVCVALSPQDAEPYARLASAYTKKSLIDKTIEYYQKALNLRSDWVETHINLANAYLAKGLTDKAIEHYLASLNLKPDYADAHYNLGIAYLEIGAMEKARKEFETALQLNPDDTQAQQFLNDIYNSTAKTR